MVGDDPQGFEQGGLVQLVRRKQQLTGSLEAGDGGVNGDHGRIVGMVALGCGVGVVPQLVLKSNPFGDSVRVLDVAPELHPFRIGLCCRQASLVNPLVGALWGLAGEGLRRG